MSGRGRRILAAAVVALPIAAVTALLGSSGRAAGGVERTEFQRLMGGLGMGPAVDLSRCACEFDPRVAWTCSLRHDPLPGGSRFCPAHGER